MIDESLAKKQKEREGKEPSGFISPSQLGRCFRFQYWQRKGEAYSNPIDARTLRVFACGNLFHDFVQQFLPPHQVEVECQKDDIRGRADIVTTDTIYDIKSMHSKGFFYLSKQGYDITKEKESNWLQLAVYATILNKPKIKLVLISKDDLCINEYEDKTAEWGDKLARELYWIRKYWVEGLPDAIPRAYGGKECDYCSYLKKCKEIGGTQWKSTKS